MKLVHLTDTHLNQELILGSDPIENFAACLKHVEINHSEADRIVITGDLTQLNKPSAVTGYARDASTLY